MHDVIIANKASLGITADVDHALHPSAAPQCRRNRGVQPPARGVDDGDDARGRAAAFEALLGLRLARMLWSHWLHPTFTAAFEALLGLVDRAVYELLRAPGEKERPPGQPIRCGIGARVRDRCGVDLDPQLRLAPMLWLHWLHQVDLDADHAGARRVPRQRQADRARATAHIDENRCAARALALPGARGVK